ncbi:helix-turn-helix transcriptional regulator [Neobacillus niacini]|uniref:helix-turn-helix transcriptional regulator n=1 Tax=Neobacillus niacini TaxID=86668 RepID=UPI0005EEB966|nr:PAS domain-containing protein [Neobacillus niacini]
MNRKVKEKEDILDHYKKLVEFLGIVLGENYEVILHIIEKGNSYVGAIANNHISGRTINAPLTGLALKMMKDKTYQDNDYVTNYKGFTKLGAEVRGSTYFIKDENNELIGMLCINFDSSKHKKIANDILDLVQTQLNMISPIADETAGSIEEKIEERHDHEIIEYFSDSIEEVVHLIVDPVLLNENVVIKQEQKIDIIKQLSKKGIFQLKGAVSQVAELLNISEPSVYRYLKMIDKDKK